MQQDSLRIWLRSEVVMSDAIWIGELERWLLCTIIQIRDTHEMALNAWIHILLLKVELSQGFLIDKRKLLFSLNRTILRRLHQLKVRKILQELLRLRIEKGQTFSNGTLTFVCWICSKLQNSQRGGDHPADFYAQYVKLFGVCESGVLASFSTKKQVLLVKKTCEQSQQVRSLHSFKRNVRSWWRNVPPTQGMHEQCASELKR